MQVGATSPRNVERAWIAWSLTIAAVNAVAIRRLQRGRRATIAVVLMMLGAAAFLPPAGATSIAATTPSSATPVQQASWLSYHGDPSNNALFAPWSTPAASWRSASVQDEMFAGSVVGDTVYAAGAGQTHAVYAINRANGQIRWAQIVNNLVMTQPIVVAGRVFVGTGNNYMREAPVTNWTHVSRGSGVNAVYSLNAATGQVIWSRPVVGEAMPTPIFVGGILYVATGDRHLLALSAETGAILWLLALPSYVSMSSPVQDGSLLLFGGAHPYAEYAVDIRTRRVVWQHIFTPVDGQAVTGAIDDCSGAVAHHVIYCTGTTSITAHPRGGTPVRQFAWALDTRTGAVLWLKDEGAGVLPNFFSAGVPTVLGGVVYIPTPANKGLDARGAGNGLLHWHLRLDGKSRSAPVVIRDHIYTSDDMGTVYDIKRAGGVLLHRLHLGGGVSNIGLTLSNGVLYVPNALGGVVDAVPVRLFSRTKTLDVASPFPPVSLQVGTSSCG